MSSNKTANSGGTVLTLEVEERIREDCRPERNFRPAELDKTRNSYRH